MRDKFLGIWPIWNVALKQKSRLRFLAVVFGILGPTLSAFYLITNRSMANLDESVWDFSIPLDHQIPFIAWSVLFYHTLYIVFYPLPLFSVPDSNQGRKEMLICSQAMFVISLTSCIIFVILPAEVYTRSVAIDSIATNPGWYNPLFEWLWVIDAPYNSWPSLHVSTAGLLTMFAIRWWKGRPALQWGIGILWVLMCLSILTTKQHFIWDLVTSLILTASVWRWQVKPGLEKLEPMVTKLPQ